MVPQNSSVGIDYARLETTDSCKEIQGTDGPLTISGLEERNIIKRIIFHICCTALLGIPHVVLNSFPRAKAVLKYKSCPLSICNIVLIKDSHNDYSLENVESLSYKPPKCGRVRVLKYFKHRLAKYVDHDDGEGFEKVEGIFQSPINKLLEDSVGFTKSEQQEMLRYYGPNLISIDVKSYWRLLVDEVLNPFYLFQVFSITLWSLDEYYYYAACVLFLSAISVCTALYTTKKQSIALRDLVSASNASLVIVCRKNGSDEEINAEHLVPGDIISLPGSGCTMNCDALLLSGSCIVNESMLTGESVPVMKTPPPRSDDDYRPSVHKRHTLYSGTEVLQTRYYEKNKVQALVVRTGFSTSKGELVRSIMFPKPMGFKFYADAVKFVLCLFLIAVLGMGYCVFVFLNRGVHLSMLILRTLDMITIVVPPALPVAMTAGPYYAQKRLKRNHSIFCISPASINICGKIKLVCFDKTGTLTEDGLNIHGVVPCDNSEFSKLVKELSELPVKSPLLATLATCHSLTRINGVLQGDPLDLIMFENTDWDMEEPGVETNKYDVLIPTVVKPKDGRQPVLSDKDLPYEIGIIRQFPFSSDEACMSVIGRALGCGTMALYTKGAPERIVKMCRPETIPLHYGQLLAAYGVKGFRVIALAWKVLEKEITWRVAQRVKRQELEHGMEFLGLLVMQNHLKPQTAPVIKKLQDAGIRTVMITGDNIMTAISVARECGMVLPSEEVVEVKATNVSDVLKIKVRPVNASPEPSPDSPSQGNEQTRLSIASSFHYALDGHSWSLIRRYRPEIIPGLAARGTVFARMGPDQKTQLVKELQSLDYIVGMCGDGANDCGALKAAHIGISLSEAEASVAAPFTSAVPDISCVLSLILEGRCSLTTSFTVFKYMALYSIIQFVSILILYANSSTLGNMQFLYIDLVITTSLALFMGLTGPAKELTQRRPSGSLASVMNALTLLLQVTASAAIQIGAVYFLQIQKWYSPLPNGPIKEIILCWENTVVFTISCFQYLVIALVYNKGKPYRKPLYTNVPLLVTIICIALFNMVLMLYPAGYLAQFFELMPLTRDKDEFKFREYVCLFPLLHLILAALIENLVADKKWLKRVIHRVVCKREPKSKYKRVLSVPAHWSSIQHPGSSLRYT